MPLPPRSWKRSLLGQVFAADGQASEALAGGGEDGVARRRSDDRQARFTDAGGVFRALRDVHFDLRSLVDARHLVVVEIGLLDAAAIDGDGVVQRGGEAVD